MFVPLVSSGLVYPKEISLDVVSVVPDIAPKIFVVFPATIFMDICQNISQTFALKQMVTQFQITAHSTTKVSAL